MNDIDTLEHYTQTLERADYGDYYGEALKNNIDVGREFASERLKIRERVAAQAIMSRSASASWILEHKAKRNTQIMVDTTSVVSGGGDVPYAKRRHYKTKRTHKR